MARGFDFSWAHPDPASLAAAGATFVCRYLSNDPSKNLSLAEAQNLARYGIAVVCNWETTANRTEAGYAAGVADAQAALAEAIACGMPDGRPIYFSVDEPSSAGAADYFRGVASVLGLQRTGAYGGYQTIRSLFDAGLVAYGWQTFAWSSRWDGNKWVLDWDPRAQLRQVENGITVGGAEVDRNESQTADFGQWPYRGDEELQPADWDKLTGIVKQAVSDGVKAEIAFLMGQRTLPKGIDPHTPSTMAGIMDTLSIFYRGIEGDPTHPSVAAQTAANVSVAAVSPEAVRAALSGLRISGSISE